MSDGLRIGIDLGTTNSVVAVLEAGGPRAITDRDGHALVPSVVAVDDDGKVLVGRVARELAARRPDRALARFKTEMGTSRTWDMAGHALTPVLASTLVLREVRALAEEALGAPVTRAVVSVPAWFGETQRRATREAAELAGLTVERLVNEPTAAALAYGLHEGDVERKVAVLDLGGGTFDVTLVELFAQMVEVRASVGDAHLGGEDVTDAVVGWIVDRGRVPADVTPSARGLLRQRAEAAKRRLTLDDTVEVSLDGVSPEGGALTLTRAGLDDLSRGLLQRLRRCVRDALAQAGWLPNAVDEVLMVGGATRMRAVRELAEELFGQPPRTDVDPDLIVGLGAAVQSGLQHGDHAVGDLVSTDVLTHSLGTAVVKQMDSQMFEGRFDPILARGTTLPASRVHRYWPVHPAQAAIRIDVYEGEHRLALENTKVASLLVEVPVTGNVSDGAVDVRFTHDANGLLEVEVTVVKTGAHEQVVVERGGAALDPAARMAAIAALARLKSHPRELLPNRLLVERAQRILASLPPRHRRVLDDVLLAFEAALEAQEPEVIDGRRGALHGLCEQLAAEHGLDP